MNTQRDISRNIDYLSSEKGRLERSVEVLTGHIARSIPPGESLQVGETTIPSSQKQ